MSSKRQRTTSRAVAAGAGGAILVRFDMHMLLGGLVIVILFGLCVYLFVTRKPQELPTTTINQDYGYSVPVQVIAAPAAVPLADVLRNPYEAPLRDDRFFPMPTGGLAATVPTGGLAINVPTQGPFIEPSYRQIGLLTRLKKEGSKKGGVEDDESLVFPLMGKPLLANRDTWNFYTMNDKFHTMKLPVIHKGRSGTSENGCENIYTNDRVKVEGYNDEFRATVYENQTMRYLPF
jgi:hypothetical protein